MRRQVVWTPYRKLMANLLPALFFVPLFAIGMIMYQRGEPIVGVALMAAAPIVGVFAVNRFGLFENEKMKKELASTRLSDTSIFVGLGKPGSLGPLDPHDDIGWLTISPDAIEFLGEGGKYRVLRSEVRDVRFRRNVHSVLGLGRWVSIEAQRDGKNLRMLIEPREHRTHLANKKLGTELQKQLRDWVSLRQA